MVSIEWCKKQSKGIKLIEPNDNLFNEYIQTAKETLEILKAIKGKSKVWLATTKYYCEYFAVYALLMKLGFKCEIHECTIQLTKLLEKIDLVPQGYSKILSDDKQLRIDNQYYLKNRDVKIDYGNIVEFVLKIEDIALKIKNEDIKKIRELVEGGKND